MGQVLILISRRFLHESETDCCDCAESIAWIDSPTVLTNTVERVKSVRSLGMDVGVDFHGRLHKGMARQLAKLLEPHQPMFIEGEIRLTLKHCHFVCLRSHAETPLYVSRAAPSNPARGNCRSCTANLNAHCSW